MCSGHESRNCRILQLAGDTFSLLHIPDRHAIVWPRLLTLGPCTSCPRGIFLCLFLDFPCLAHRHCTPRRLGSSLPTRLLPSKVPPLLHPSVRLAGSGSFFGPFTIRWTLRRRTEKKKKKIGGRSREKAGRSRPFPLECALQPTATHRGNTIIPPKDSTA